MDDKEFVQYIIDEHNRIAGTFDSEDPGVNRFNTFATLYEQIHDKEEWAKFYVFLALVSEVIRLKS